MNHVDRPFRWDASADVMTAEDALMIVNQHCSGVDYPEWVVDMAYSLWAVTLEAEDAVCALMFAVGQVPS